MNFEELSQDPVNRRAFLQRMAAAGLGIAAAGLFAAAPAEASGSPLLNIVNVPDNANFPGIPGRKINERVLNYALTLEILEADIYRQALNLASGKPLTTPLPDDTSAYRLSIEPGAAITHPEEGFLYLQQFAAVEAAHRDFLRTAIQSMGGTPVEPNPGGYKAPFGSDLRSVLEVIRTLEETGVRAYLGAASSITDFKLIQAAASIYSTESRHSAAVNYVLGIDIGPAKQRIDSQAVYYQHGDNNFEYFLTPEQVLNKAKAFYA